MNVPEAEAAVPIVIAHGELRTAEPDVDAAAEKQMVEAAGAVASAWNTAAVEYVVLNGLEGYPERIGRDLDVVVRRGEGKRVLAIAAGVLRARGWIVTYPPDTWGLRVVAFSGTYGLEIHTLERLTWGPAVLYPEPRADGCVGPFKTDSHGRFVKRVVLPLLARRYGKVSAARDAFGDAGNIAAHLRRLLAGSGEADEIARLARLLVAGGASDLESARTGIASKVVRRALLGDLAGAAARTVGWLGTRVKRYAWRSGLTVALVGPDGVGKSSVAAALETVDRSVFTDVHVRHWRPGLLPDLGRLARLRPKHDGGGPVAPRRRAGRFYWPRLLYYSLDFWLGHHLKDRWLLGRQVLLLYDRAFLDMLVDPVRYGLGSTSGMMSLWRMLPKPDLIIVLRDDPERVHARKPELGVAEVHRQLEAWHALVEAGEVRVVDVCGSPEVVAGRVQELIIDAFVARYGERPAGAAMPADGMADGMA